MIEITIRTSNAFYKLALINNLVWPDAHDLMNWPGVFTQQGVLMNVTHETDERVYIITDYNL
jgi:hypothetical protein